VVILDKPLDKTDICGTIRSRIAHYGKRQTMKAIALCSALAFGALTSAALAETANRSGPFELSNEQLDKIAAGNNGNTNAGYGTGTATSTSSYFNNSGHPGTPENDTAPGLQTGRSVGTANGSRSGQSVGSGRDTHCCR
jgi:hypothetical protein